MKFREGSVIMRIDCSETNFAARAIVVSEKQKLMLEMQIKIYGKWTKADDGFWGDIDLIPVGNEGIEKSIDALAEIIRDHFMFHFFERSDSVEFVHKKTRKRAR